MSRVEKKKKKDFIIRVRVTRAEQEQFRQQAKALGYKTVSAYVRSLLDADQEHNQASAAHPEQR